MLGQVLFQRRRPFGVDLPVGHGLVDLGGAGGDEASITTCGSTSRSAATAAGQVVGINTAVAPSSGGIQASNIGFAISIDRALAVSETLLDRNA